MGAEGKEGCFERLNSTMHGFWNKSVNVWGSGWREAMNIVHSILLL